MPKSVLSTIAGRELKTRRTPTNTYISVLRAFLSPKQRAFIDHPSKRKIARCGRRAGKTVGFGVKATLTCLSAPRTPVLFLGLTRDSAMRAIWLPLLAVLDAAGIKYDAKSSFGTIHFENQSYIQIFGADSSKAADRLRGSSWALIGVDESGFHVDSNFDQLVTTLMPSLGDYDGELWFLSSPGYLKEGLFWHYDVGPGCNEGHGVLKWFQMHWTLLDNPFYQRPPNRTKPDGAVFATYGHQYLWEICNSKYAGNENHPAYRREYLGEWVFDSSSLIYPWTSLNQISDFTDMRDSEYGLGMDLGSASATAIVVVKYSQLVRHVEVVHAYKEENLLVDGMARLLQDAIKKYSTSVNVADTGGLGKVPVEEFRRRYHLPVLAAEKTEKTFFQRIVANDLHSGYIKAHPSSPLFSEWSRIVKDPKTGEELKGQENHLADAFLYIYRRIYTTHLKDFIAPLSEEDSIRDRIEQEYAKQLDPSSDFTEAWER